MFSIPSSPYVYPRKTWDKLITNICVLRFATCETWVLVKFKWVPRPRPSCYPGGRKLHLPLSEPPVFTYGRGWDSWVSLPVGDLWIHGCWQGNMGKIRGPWLLLLPLLSGCFMHHYEGQHFCHHMNQCMYVRQSRRGYSKCLPSSSCSSLFPLPVTWHWIFRCMPRVVLS